MTVMLTTADAIAQLKEAGITMAFEWNGIRCQTRPNVYVTLLYTDKLASLVPRSQVAYVIAEHGRNFGGVVLL